ncbi:MAG: CRISPR-associated helicase Cas3' [Verrucomicrobiota bacterium]
MNQLNYNQFWAKTTPSGEPGLSVFDHCVNVGFVAEAFLSLLPENVKREFSEGASILAALHDIGKITLGFQMKCAKWRFPVELDESIRRMATASVSDHALVSQVFLQTLLKPSKAHLWAAAVGAHHGRPKGRNARFEFEAAGDWASVHRQAVAAELIQIFGPLPAEAPSKRFSRYHSDLWLLAGLITVADWIGSNEEFFSSERGVSLSQARKQAKRALAVIGWPGGKLRLTAFDKAFSSKISPGFEPNSVQQCVAVTKPGIVIVEAPMGCGKTEAALHVAQKWINAGHHHGFYFALPTQVTSNRIHLRVADFLENVIEDTAHLRLAHSHAWLEVTPVIKLRQAHYSFSNPKDGEDPADELREARSWFASGKQALLAPYGVGTIDQALQSMVTVKHFFVRRFGLAGKVVILDEIHSYDVYTGTLVCALVRELLHLGCSVIILSATLTTQRRRELLASAGCSESGSPDAYPLVTEAVPGGGVKYHEPEWIKSYPIKIHVGEISTETVLEELIDRAEAGQHVLWIRNTVIEAQQGFRALKDEMREGDVKLGLLHARFPFERRQELEKDWLNHLGKNRSSDGPGSILIATQVVEQSVDIDLDFIVSDLAPTDMIVQRMGRLWRHERPLGQRTAEEPEFWIRLPQLDEDANSKMLRIALGRSGRVYAPYVLLRSAQVWQGRSKIIVPVQIREVLEATYALPADDEPCGWSELYEMMETEKRKLALNAESAMRVLGLPMLNADDDGVLTRRKGPPTVPLVILQSIEQLPSNQWRLTALDTKQSTLNISDFEWSIHAARFLHRWFVRVPKWLVPSDAQCPHWLTEHVSHDAVVACMADDGYLIFGEEKSSTSYHPDFGVFVDHSAKTRPHTEPEPWSEDDDEFDQ